MGLKDWLGRLFLGPSAVPPLTSQNETVRTAPPSVVDAAVLVLAPTVTATTQPVQAQSGQIPRRHWAPTGFFPVCAVGESFYQEAIQSIAVNEGYVGALVYCMACLLYTSDAADE